jgi:phage baseplate assembly protein gpV
MPDEIQPAKRVRVDSFTNTDSQGCLHVFLEDADTTPLLHAGEQVELYSDEGWTAEGRVCPGVIYSSHISIEVITVPQKIEMDMEWIHT